MKNRVVLSLVMMLLLSGLTSGCVVAETVILTVHTRHGAAPGDYEQPSDGSAPQQSQPVKTVRKPVLDGPLGDTPASR